MSGESPLSDCARRVGELDLELRAFLARSVDLIELVYGSRTAGLCISGVNVGLNMVLGHPPPAQLVRHASHELIACDCTLERSNISFAEVTTRPGGERILLWVDCESAPQDCPLATRNAVLFGLAQQVHDYLVQHRALVVSGETDQRRAIAVAYCDQLQSLDDWEKIDQVALAAISRALAVNRIGFGLVGDRGGNVEFRFVPIDDAELLTGDFPLAAFGLEQNARSYPRWVQFPAPNSVTVAIVRERKLKAVLYLHRSAADATWNEADILFALELADRLWTERDWARANAALQASEARLRTVLEGVTDAFYVLDCHWRFTVFNRAAESFFQLRREDVLGRKLVDVIPTARGSVFEQCFARVMARSKSESFASASTSRPDRYVQCRIYPQAGGGVAASFNDVTEQRRLDLAVQDREAHLAALYAQSGVGLAETDLDGRFIAANAEFCRIVGRRRDDLLRLRMPDVTHADDLQATYGLIKRLTLGVGVFSIQKRYVRPDGSVCHVANTVSLIHHASKPATTLVVAKDISERRAAELALRSADLEISTLQAGKARAVATTNSSGWFTAATEGFCCLIGRTKQEILRSTVLDITHPDDLEASRQLYSRMRDGGEPFEIAYRLLRPDGEAVWLTSLGGFSAIGSARDVVMAAWENRAARTSGVC